MKFLIVAILMFLGLSACSSHGTYNDKGYFDRANKASQRALDKLDRE